MGFFWIKKLGKVSGRVFVSPLPGLQKDPRSTAGKQTSFQAQRVWRKIQSGWWQNEKMQFLLENFLCCMIQVGTVFKKATFGKMFFLFRLFIISHIGKYSHSYVQKIIFSSLTVSFCRFATLQSKKACWPSWMVKTEVEEDPRWNEGRTGGWGNHFRESYVSVPVAQSFALWWR